ncbi:MAG: sensor histidine kinase [Myxococcaceae bacterium]
MPWALVLGDTRGARVRVFVDGRHVADTVTVASAFQRDVLGLDVFPVSTLSAGTHTVAMDVTTELPGLDFIADDRFWLAPEGEARAFVNRVNNLRRSVLTAAFATLSLFALVCFVLAVTFDSARRRQQYRSAALALATSVLYLAINFGLASANGTHASLWIHNYIVIAGFFISYPDFVYRFISEHESRVLWWNRAIVLALVAAFIFSYWLFGLRALTFGQVMLAWVVVPSAYVVYRVAGIVVRAWKPEHPFLVGSLFCLVTTGTYDTLRDMNLLSGPRFFVLGVSFTGLFVGGAIVSDLVRTARDQQRLRRSLEITNMELVKSLNAERALAKLKSDFVANVSHELRTPLNSIVNMPAALMPSFVETPALECPACGATFAPPAGEKLHRCPSCGSQGKPASQPHYVAQGEMGLVVSGLKQIERTGHFLLGLVNRILDFSRFESTETKLALGPVPLLACLRRVLDGHPGASRVQLRVDPSHVALADEVALQQVVMNLLDNALRFSPPSSRVEIWSEAKDADVLLHIRDSGIGIEPRHHEVIFEAFRQVDGSTTRPYGGTGLGLAIAKRMTEAQKGHIWVDSALGQGATFHVALKRPGAPSV